MVGKHLNDRNMIDEGIIECKIASTLCEGWDMPLVEPGIILINAGYFDEALVELAEAHKKLPETTLHLALNRGHAFMCIKEYEKALRDFEFVINIKPDYALALDHAAYCAFMLQDQVKGRKYAKEARKFGSPQTYNEWRRGLYKRKKS